MQIQQRKPTKALDLYIQLYISQPFTSHFSNRPGACEVVNHPWLDVGHNIHQDSDGIVFPTVEFVDLSTRLQSLLEKTMQIAPTTW